MLEIIVAGEHRQVMANAQLCQQRIDRSDSHTTASAAIAQLRRMNVILAIGHQQGDRRKPGQLEVYRQVGCHV
jgi:hypothetical protein